VKVVPENEERDVPENEEKGVPGVPEKKKKRFGLKSVLLAVVALAVVGSLVQVVLRSSGFGGALSTTGEQEGPKKPGAEEKVEKPKKEKTVKLGDKRVPRQSGPIIVINPGLVAPGGKAMVQGAGFDAKATVDLLLKTKKSAAKGKTIATVKSDRNGSINAAFRTPETGSGKPTVLVAQQRGGGKVAEAKLVSGGGIGTVRISKAAGKPGDAVSLSIRGFSPGEQIKVYWGRTTGTPVATLTADGSGGIGRADIKVGVAPTGNSTLVLVGKKSKTTATAPFQMLGLYPAVKSSPYALKSAQRLSVSAKGFAPNERVLFYINSAGGVPAFTANADANGNVGTVSFTVPFGLKGKQSLTVIGDQTRAVVRAGFQVMPYTPTAEPSAYGGRAGTTLSFYVTGFAPNEKVTLYAGGTEGGGGKKISTFQVDGRGKADAAGAYKITKADEGGVSFRLIGHKSGSTAEAGVNNTKGQGQGGSGQEEQGK
jgi:hypothetical protein